MSKPIYSLFLAKPTEAWYQLSQEEQNSLMEKVGPITEKVGGKNVVMCNSSWSSEQWQLFGVHEFPNIEAVQKHYELLSELNWLRYVDSMTVLGTEFPQS
jgi:hypothetical protein